MRFKFIIFVIGICIGFIGSQTYLNKKDTEMNHDMSMQSQMTNMTLGLQGKSGKTLEKEFITEMIPHHQGAVDMANMLLADPNTKPELRKFAEEIISAQTREIQQMNIWLQDYK